MSLLDTTKFTVLAGLEVVEAQEARKAAVVLPSKNRAGCLDSETLCAFQRSESQRGIIGANLIMTLDGWSIRYDSGLQNFGLLLRGRNTYEEAVAWGRAWVAEDPERRYFWCYVADAQ